MSKPAPIIPNHVPPKPRPPAPKISEHFFSVSQQDAMFEHAPNKPRPKPQPKPN